MKEFNSIVKVDFAMENDDLFITKWDFTMKHGHFAHVIDDFASFNKKDVNLEKSLDTLPPSMGL